MQTRDKQCLVGISNSLWVVSRLVRLLSYPELLSLLLLSFFATNLPLSFFCVREVRFFAFLHALALARVHHPLGLFFAQAREQLADTVHIFGPDAVNVAVERSSIWERGTRREELEQVRGEKVRARHLGCRLPAKTESRDIRRLVKEGRKAA